MSVQNVIIKQQRNITFIDTEIQREGMLMLFRSKNVTNLGIFKVLNTVYK